LKSVAVLVGNAEYIQENDLPCCREDVSAFQSLLETNGRFDEIIPKVNLDADEMRTVVREALSLNCLTSAPMGQFRHIAERRVSGSS